MMATATSVRIVTDSTADLPPALAGELEVSIVPLNVLFGERSYRDGVDLTSAEFYRLLRSTPALPTTSQPGVSAFVEAYEPLVAAGHRVVSMHLSATLSGTYANAVAAARAFPDGAITVVDSRTVTMGLGWSVVAAAEAARAGAELAEVLALAKRALARACVFAMVDTLEYLQRGGRIGRARALAGAVLAIKPLIEFRDGELHVADRVRTRSRAVQRLADLVTAGTPAERLAVLHGNAPEGAAQLAALLATALPDRKIITRDIGPVIGTHVGPGALGVAFLAADQP